MSQPSDRTIEYYEAHASEFYDQTVAVDMSALYAPFLSLLPAGAHILDAGCGSGRDSQYFLRHGYTVTSFDASVELSKLASRLTGRPVKAMRFEDLNSDAEFDGVWACASLLHVPRTTIHSVLETLTKALKVNGVMFLSFKLRDGEWEQKGRFFNGYDLRSFPILLHSHPALACVSTWTSKDARPERRAEEWLNAILRRRDLLRNNNPQLIQTMV